MSGALPRSGSDGETVVRLSQDEISVCDARAAISNRHDLRIPSVRERELAKKEQASADRERAVAATAYGTRQEFHREAAELHDRAAALHDRFADMDERNGH